MLHQMRSEVTLYNCMLNVKSFIGQNTKKLKPVTELGSFHLPFASSIRGQTCTILAVKDCVSETHLYMHMFGNQ